MESNFKINMIPFPLTYMMLIHHPYFIKLTSKMFSKQKWISLKRTSLKSMAKTSNVKGKFLLSVLLWSIDPRERTCLEEPALPGTKIMGSPLTCSVLLQ